VAPQQIQQDGEININKVQYGTCTLPYLSLSGAFFVMISLSTQLGMLGRVCAFDPDPHYSASILVGSASESEKPDPHPHRSRI
jgi:hypothetical protein